MPARLVDRERRTKLAKASIRPLEKDLLVEIAEELGVTPSEVVYLAVIQMLHKHRPAECKRHKIRANVLVTG